VTTTKADRIDDGLCEALVARACAGDEEVWKELLLHLWPHLQAIVRGSRALGGMARNEDHVHDVLTALVDKLGTDGGRAITRYPAWKVENPTKTFSDWIRIVASFTVNDYVRAALGRRRAASSSGEDPLPSIKRLLNEFATAPANEELYGQSRPPFTAAQTARQLLEFAEATLAPAPRRALALWLDGASFEEIGADLSVDDAEARKLVRASVATLRRRFAAQGSAEPVG
jgi:DNA-directed RNA polymerase specialized sigma24 family protein